MSLIAAYASRISSGGAGVCSESRLTGHRLVPFIHFGLVLAFVVCVASWKCPGAEVTLPLQATGHLEGTNSQELLRAYLQLREQLESTQLAIEQNRQETTDAASRNVAALSEGLHSLQQAFSAQRAKDMETMWRSNKVMLVGVGMFAGMAFLTLLTLSYFQWRMSKGLARISAALPAALGLDPASVAAALALANQPELPLFGATKVAPENRIPGRQQSARPALQPYGGTNLPFESPLFSEPGALVRRRRFRAVSIVVIVGLICAAGLALLLYMVAYRKLGFG